MRHINVKAGRGNCVDPNTFWVIYLYQIPHLEGLVQLGVVLSGPKRNMDCQLPKERETEKDRKILSLGPKNKKEKTQRPKQRVARHGAIESETQIDVVVFVQILTWACLQNATSSVARGRLVCFQRKKEIKRFLS